MKLSIPYNGAMACKNSVIYFVKNDFIVHIVPRKKILKIFLVKNLPSAVVCVVLIEIIWGTQVSQPLE